MSVIVLSLLNLVSVSSIVIIPLISFVVCLVPNKIRQCGAQKKIHHISYTIPRIYETICYCNFQEISTKKSCGYGYKKCACCILFRIGLSPYSISVLAPSHVTLWSNFIWKKTEYFFGSHCPYGYAVA
jgi:hypothetical protein